MKKTQKSPNKLSNNWTGTLIGAAAFLISAALVQAYPAAFGALIVLILFTGIGYWYGSWYAKHGKHNKGFLQFLFWSNVATWLIPAIGFMTSAASYRINRDNHSQDRKQYMIIAGICFGLSLVNGTAGAIIRTAPH